MFNDGGYYGNYLPQNNFGNRQYTMPQVQQPQMQQQQSGMLWVQGEAAAKSYLVAPGNTVVLWDSENPCIYIRAADISGIPSMRVFEYKERTAGSTEAENHQCKCSDKFVAKDEFKALCDRVEALSEKIGGTENA